MRVLLVNPNTRKYYDGYPITLLPPLGILYIAATLEREGHHVVIVDADIDDISTQELAEILQRDKPCVVGITCTTFQYPAAVETARTVKEFLPETTVVVGGAHPTALQGQTLEECKNIDIVVRGEGETAMVELCQALEAGTSLKAVSGTIYRNDDGSIVENPDCARPVDPDSLPFPAHHLNRPVERYSKHYRSVLYPGASVVTSRGCPFRCIFCANSNKLVRLRSPESVVEEVETLVRQHGIAEVDFHDDTFNLKPRRTLRICELLVERGLNRRIAWRAECRANNGLVSCELFSAMKAAGCHLVSFGVESGSQRVLDIMQKDVTLEEVQAAFGAARDAGLRTRAFFMIGNLGESKGDVLKSLEFAKRLAADSYQFTIVTPYPGSPLYEIARHRGWIRAGDWRTWTQWQPVMETEHLSVEDLSYFKDLADREFAPPRYHLRRLIDRARRAGRLAGYQIRLRRGQWHDIT